MSLFKRIKEWFSEDKPTVTIKPGDIFYIDNKPFKYGISEPDRIYVHIIFRDRYYKIFAF